MASSLFNLWTDTLFPQSCSKFSLVYLLAWYSPLHTPYISSPNHCLLFAAHPNKFCCSTEIMSFNPSLSLNHLLGALSCSLMPHIHLTILISALWSATSFSILTGQVSLPCNILLRTQLLYNLHLTINDISLLVSNGTNCLNLFHSIWILVSTATSVIFKKLNRYWDSATCKPLLQGCHPKAKIHIFHTSIELGIIGYHDPDQPRHAGNQDTDLSCHLLISTFCCMMGWQSANVTDRWTDGQHAHIAQNSLLAYYIVQSIKLLKHIKLSILE